MQHITKEDNICSQSHESLGFDRICADFDQDGVKVVNHAHKRNATINKLNIVKQETKGTVFFLEIHHDNREVTNQELK